MKTRPHSPGAGATRSGLCPVAFDSATSSRSRVNDEPKTGAGRPCSLGRLLSFILLHSFCIFAAEPSRQELWVPTTKLDTVLKAHPNAVMLSAEEYEALVRDAGKIKQPDDPDTAPPKLIAIEGLKLTGKAEPNAANVTLQGELTLSLPSKEWLSTKIAWPFAMSSVTAEGNVLAYVEPAKDEKTKAANARDLILFVKGPGATKLRFEAMVPVFLRTHLGEHTLEVPDVPFGGVLNLELPAGVRLLAGSALEQTGSTLKVAFDHRAHDDHESNLQPGTPRAFRVRWIESSHLAAQTWRCSETAQVTISVTESEVAAALTFGVRAEGDAANEFEVEWQLAGKDTQVTDIVGGAVRRWRQDGGKLFVTLVRDGRMQNLVVSLRRSITSAAEAGDLPLLVLNPPVHALATLQLAPDLDFLDLAGAKQTQANAFEFQLGVDQPKIVLRTSKPRLESDVDVIARIDKDSVQLERKVMLRSDRPVNEIKITLPAGEEFNAVLSKLIGSGQTVSLSNAGTLNVAQQASISNVATITPNNINQPVFNSSQQVVTPNNGSIVPAGSPFRLTWRRVGQTIAILPAQPLSPTNALEFSVTSRLKLAKAWKGPRTPETVTVEHLQIPEAVKVAGYTALDFDDAWRVALKEAKGLEDRDARLTPVKGRMAWFGLREHTLTFEVERAEAVFSTEVTAYALPRARTIEIEGQFALDISGAPLRSFQVKLPVEVAKLLRVTSPLVGEQQLDEAAGVWTFTLRQESKWRQNVRWRMSLPSAGAGRSFDGDGPNANDKRIRATLPHLELPQSRRFTGTWVIEANTDTQLSTTMQNMQPLDVLRVPAVAGYQPRHRVTSAFTYGAGENALTITAQRHAHSELAALVVNRMTLTSVLGADGHSLHEATLDLSHSGEQFVSLHLPKDAELLSTSSGGQAVKPVRGVEDAVAVPLPAGSANAPHTEVRVQFRQNGAPWDASGTQKLEPVRIVGNVPVLSTEWFVHAPAAFGYGKVDTTLEQEGMFKTPLLTEVGAYWHIRRLLSSLKTSGAADPAPAYRAAAELEKLGVDIPNAAPALKSSKVQKGLLLANSSAELGNFDAAISQYQDVLRTDPYNAAARRGMENAERKKMEYFKSAYDHQRSKMLAQVDEKWEDKMPVLAAAMPEAPPDPFAAARPGSAMVAAPKTAGLMQKMDRIILPRVQLQGATIEEAIEYLRTKSRDLDMTSSGGGGVNVILRNGDAPSNASISLDLKDVPFSEALRYVTELAQMKYKVEAGAVRIVPITENASEQHTRTFRVPPDFLTAGGGDLGAAAPADPFAAGGPSAGSGLIARRTAKQILEAQGITFPEGASASYNPATSELVVRNTQPNLDLIEAFDEGLSKKELSKDMRRLSESLVEMQLKSGLIPLDVVLPETGRLLRFRGAQPPEVLALHYTSWSQQIVRAMLAIALGLALFWRHGRKRPWLMTLLVVVLAAWGAPLLFEGTWLALTNAIAFGWLCAGVLRLLGWLFGFMRVKEESKEPKAESLMSWVRGLRSFVIRPSVFVISFFALSVSLTAEDKAAKKEPADPAAHTVIVPYDAKKPLAEQKAERFYLGYEEFQRLWKAAKENRRAPAAEVDGSQHAVIHGALYQGRVEERGLVLEARITATTRGEWANLLLPFAQIVGGKETAKALVGEVRVDGKSAALSNGFLTLEHPGMHAIELTATLPLPREWQDLTLRLPPSLSGMLALRTPKSDGWLRVNGVAANAVEEHAEGRLFTQTLGTHREVRLQRSSRGLERGEGPVPAATVRGTLTLRELEPEVLDAVVEYEFPGAVRRTLEFAVDETNGKNEKNGLEIGVMAVFTTIPNAGEVEVPVMTTQARSEGGKRMVTLTLRHEVSHGATIRVTRASRHVNAAGVRTLPLIQPLAQRVKQDVAVLHDDTMKVQVNGGTAQRSANSERGSLTDAGRWQWSGGPAPTYEVTPAALFAEADVGYVFQLSEQKAELLAALTLKRKSGVWTRAVVGLQADYEVQAVQGPALTAWQHEGGQLYLHLDPNIAGMEARVVVHVARVAAQAVTAWTLESLKLENYEKVAGKALVVAHAANEVKLPDLAQRSDLKELDATVLDSVFAIAPPMEKKRALQHEGTTWKMDVALTRQVSRYSADAVLMVLASDAGIRVSQQVAAVVEQGALRQVSVRLPATLPEAVVSGPLLRETRSRIEGNERVYECSLQTEVLDRAELTFDHDLPLTAELEVPFVKVPGTSRLTRWFALDNLSAREAKITTQTALEAAAREAVPYLPAGLARPQFFRATGDGVLKLAYQQLTSTEGNSALVTLADLTTVLRADGERWDIAQYSLINRSLQFLPVILPDGAELISASVSGEPVRADEETQNGKRVRLIPLIHTRPGQRALEVKMIYRFAKGAGGLQPGATLDDPELVGLSVERTAWTVWTPKGWKLGDVDGNMTTTAEEGRELQKLEGMLSELGEVNRTLSSGKLEYGDAEAAYRDANALAEKVQAKKREIQSKAGYDMPGRSDSRYQNDSHFRQDFYVSDQMDKEVAQQQQLLKGNWDSNYAQKKVAKGGKESGQITQGNTNWGYKGLSAPKEKEVRLSGNNTFSGAVTTNGGQLFNDNVAVDNTYFANGRQQQTAGMRGGQVPVNNAAITDLLAGNKPTTFGGVVAGGGGVVKTGTGTLVLNGGANTYTGGTVINGGVVATPQASQNVNGAMQTYNNSTSQGAQLVVNGGAVNLVNPNARSNSLGNLQVDAPRGTMTADVPVSLAANGPAQAERSGEMTIGSLGGRDGGLPQNRMNDGQEVNLGNATAGRLFNNTEMAALPGGGGRIAGAPVNPSGFYQNQGAVALSNAIQPESMPSINMGASTLTLNSASIAAPSVPAKPEPALAADPFAAPAAAAPPPMPAKAMKLPAAADAKKKAREEGRKSDSDGDDKSTLGLVLAQTVESLRPTGRRALEITLPMDGSVHHFSKLKDHAVLKIEIERVGDARTSSRLLCLVIGLVLWAVAWWWTARREEGV